MIARFPRSRAAFLSFSRRGDTTEGFPSPDFIFNLPAAPRQSVREEKRKRKGKRQAGGREVERKITARKAVAPTSRGALSESFRPSAINVIARTAVIKPQRCRGSFPRAKVNGIKTERRARSLSLAGNRFSAGKQRRNICDSHVSKHFASRCCCSLSFCSALKHPRLLHVCGNRPYFLPL